MIFMKLSDGNVILFLCDGLACGDACPSPSICTHTSDIRHAKNFDVVQVGDVLDYFECEPVPARVMEPVMAPAM